MPTKLKSPLKEREFYCVKCRKRVTCPKADISVKVYKNKRSSTGKSPALVCFCHKCDCNLTKFIKRTKEKALAKKYGRVR